MSVCLLDNKITPGLVLTPMLYKQRFPYARTMYFNDWLLQKTGMVESLLNHRYSRNLLGCASRSYCCGVESVRNARVGIVKRRICIFYCKGGFCQFFTHPYTTHRHQQNWPPALVITFKDREMYTFVTYVFLLVLSTLPPLFLSVHSLSTFLPIISHAFHLCQSVFLVLPMLSLLLTFLPLLIFQTLHVSVFLAVFLLLYL